MADRKLIELVIDEEQENFAVDALSLVKFPAIESDFIFLRKDNRYLSFAQVDEEQRTLIGPALIPNKNIPRYDEATKEEYEVYFSEETVKRAAELFLEQKNTDSHTFEHGSAVDQVHVVESWLVHDENMDKSKSYGLSVPKGTWMVRVKVDNDEVWESVKAGEVRGFSIEGYFVDKVVEMNRNFAEDSYSDYPESAKNNAKRARKWAEENGWGSCGTDVGKTRSAQLASGESISMETIKRAYSFLSRHAENADVPYGEGCGGLMYDAWGGKSMLNWAEGKVNAAKKTEASMQDDYIDLEEPCWDGYEMVGMKEKDGRMVPNCVPIEASKMSIAERVYKAVMKVVKPRKFYAEVKLTTGAVLATEDDTMSAGSQVFTLDEEGMPVEIGNGSYTTEGGVNLVVFDNVLTEYDGEVQAVEDASAEKSEAEPTDLKSEMLTLYYKKLLEMKKQNMSAQRREFGYNGWRNYETWLVNMYFGDYLMEIANERFEEGEGMLDRDEVEDMIVDMVYDEMGNAGGFVESLVKVSLADIDWHSITDHANER